MAAELRRAENMGEDGKIEVNRSNSDPAFSESRIRDEQSLHQLARQILTSVRVKRRPRVKPRIGNVDLAVEAGLEIVAKLGHHSGRQGPNRHQLEPQTQRHYSGRSIPYLRILL